MDLNQVAVMGHSFGGATTVQTLSEDLRFKWVGFCWYGHCGSWTTILAGHMISSLHNSWQSYYSPWHLDVYFTYHTPHTPFPDSHAPSFYHCSLIPRLSRPQLSLLTVEKLGMEKQEEKVISSPFISASLLRALITSVAIVLQLLLEYTTHISHYFSLLSNFFCTGVA